MVGKIGSMVMIGVAIVAGVQVVAAAEVLDGRQLDRITAGNSFAGSNSVLGALAALIERIEGRRLDVNEVSGKSDPRIEARIEAIATRISSSDGPSEAPAARSVNRVDEQSFIIEEGELKPIRVPAGASDFAFESSSTNAASSGGGSVSISDIGTVFVSRP